MDVIYRVNKYTDQLLFCTVGASEGLDEVTSTPPAVPADTKKDIAKATQSGVHASGPDAGAAPAAEGAPKVKTEKECMFFPSPKDLAIHETSMA